MNLEVIENKNEKDTDYLLRSLLMPRHFLIHDLLEHKDTLNSEQLIAYLAKRYQVPEFQISIRLLEIGGIINLRKNKVIYHEKIIADLSL